MDNQISSEETKVAAFQQAPNTGLEHAEVLAELDYLRNKKPDWVNGLVILFLSASAFVGFGAARWSWSVLLMLLPLLLFHEFGHFLAMRVFNYRNVRMLFIPLFGAVMTGKNYNVAGWKKVIVSLMGPVPGLMLGGMLIMTGMIVHQGWMVKAGFMALILNGFNMVPILPLDGGWVFHVLLFSRHHLLDAGFRVIAGLTLIFGSSFFGGMAFKLVGFLILIGIITSYRLARITLEIRKRNLPQPGPDSDEIPVETAQAIISEVKQAFPTVKGNRLIAQHTLSIFEQVNACPPGWLVSIGLLVIYFGSLALGLVFMAMSVIERSQLQ